MKLNEKSRNKNENTQTIKKTKNIKISIEKDKVQQNKTHKPNWKHFENFQKRKLHNEDRPKTKIKGNHHWLVCHFDDSGLSTAIKSQNF